MFLISKFFKFKVVGEHCQYINYCIVGEPCLNGGTCVPEENNYKCFCSSGFTGHDCQDDFDECQEHHPCLNGGTCLNSFGFYEYVKLCRCLSLSIDERDDCGELVYDQSARFCHNGGVYVPFLRTHNCLCNEGFTGRMCEVNIDDCQRFDGCEHGGTCVDGVNSFFCLCSPAFTGRVCELDVDECELDPGLCQNDGTCYNKFGDFECACVATWEGRYCELNVDDCRDVICTNGGSCHDLIGQFECECPSGFTGMICHLRDWCVYDNPCYGDALCSMDPVFGDYHCTCSTYYAGVNCSEPRWLKNASLSVENRLMFL
ncbi:unnamed protein product [Soboliphyme baturini]|uniref:EGF-like domain-containing protein n=1 Tax=Soboliphyme baturini TaxID=241478 RepID=A0A3P8AA04_9BILA|nr:unnamed protein product [Soboliphyme baturini]